MKPRRSPQEKKALSYAKDRRNTYAENDKSSRKNIPRSKRFPNRANRRGARQALRPAVGVPDELPFDEVEAGLKNRRPKRWRKSPDQPLALALERAFDFRVRHGDYPADRAEEKLERIRRRVAGRRLSIRF
ncbi:MAG TPA: hypothetical protein VFQ39_07265 [Longimicrobium sp.]|nr:hypothetical protein [Longimicrobium sp.]